VGKGLKNKRNKKKICLGEREREREREREEEEEEDSYRKIKKNKRDKGGCFGDQKNTEDTNVENMTNN
jgi:hypothetical protein